MTTDSAGAEQTSMSAQVQVPLRDFIVRGKFSPGERINVDKVARELGVSAIPVREALRSLEVEGWVYFIPQRGAFVSKRSKEEAASLHETRLILEPQIARIAATKRNSSDLDDLKQLVRQGHQAAASHRLSDFMDINTAFHKKLSICTHNTILVRLYTRILGYLEFYYGAAVDQRIALSASEHERIYEAVRSGDKVLAEQLAEGHATGTFDVLSSSAVPDMEK